MRMIISQLPANGDGFIDNFGANRFIDPITYDFLVTIVCEPTLTSVIDPQTMTY